MPSRRQVAHSLATSPRADDRYARRENRRNTAVPCSLLNLPCTAQIQTSVCAWFGVRTTVRLASLRAGVRSGDAFAQAPLVIFLIAAHGEGEQTNDALAFHAWLHGDGQPSGRALCSLPPQPMLAADAELQFESSARQGTSDMNAFVFPAFTLRPVSSRSCSCKHPSSSDHDAQGKFLKVYRTTLPDGASRERASSPTRKRSWKLFATPHQRPSSVLAKARSGSVWCRGPSGRPASQKARSLRIS